MSIVKAGVVLRCHKAIVLKGYHGWTTQRSSAEAKVFLEENGCNAGRWPARDVITLS